MTTDPARTAPPAGTPSRTPPAGPAGAADVLPGPVPLNRCVAFAVLLASTLAWDLYSKWWAFSTLGYPYHPSEWSWTTPFLWGRVRVQLFTSFNQGALWGLGQGYGWLFCLLSLGAVGLVVYWLFIRRAAHNWWLTICLALIASGALGNLYDRLYLHGSMAVNPRTGQLEPMLGVRDFLDFKIPAIEYRWPFHFTLLEHWQWPIFNFADAFLVTGAIMLMLNALFTREPTAMKQ